LYYICIKKSSGFFIIKYWFRKPEDYILFRNYLILIFDIYVNINGTNHPQRKLPAQQAGTMEIIMPATKLICPNRFFICFINIS